MSERGKGQAWRTPMKIACEIFVAMNEDGGYGVTIDNESKALERLAENEGGYNARIVKLTVRSRFRTKPAKRSKSKPKRVWSKY
jgi:hypothetical protein